MVARCLDDSDAPLGRVGSQQFCHTPRDLFNHPVVLVALDFHLVIRAETPP